MLKLIEATGNYVYFSFFDKTYFYENLFGTIHKAIDSYLVNELNKQSRPYYFGSNQTKNSLETLILNCTENCNLNCGYCIFSGNYSTERAHSKKKMGIEIAKKAVDYFMNNSNNPFIAFYGGEPLLEKSLMTEVVKIAKGAKFALTTNFTLAADFIDFLAENRFYVSISLDGPRQVHDSWRKTRNGQGTFETIVRNIERLSRYNDYFRNHVALSVTITNPAEINTLKNFFENDSLLANLPLRLQNVELCYLKNRSLCEMFAENAPKGEEALYALAKEYVDKILQNKGTSFFEKALFDPLVYQVFTRGTGIIRGQIHPRGMCHPGKRKLFVDCEGNFYMCEKIGNRFKIGDVKTGLNEAEANNALNTFCSIRNSLCNDCWAARDCPSCMVSAKDVEGVSENALEKRCKQIKKSMLLGLAIYSEIASVSEKIIADYLKDYTA